MSRSRALLALASLLLASACSLLTGPETRTFRGQYLVAFEASAFTPCGRSRAWWVSFASEAAMQDVYSRIPWPMELWAPTQPVYVEWRGQLSRRGQYGHMGSYPRELLVTAVSDVRVWTPDACD